MLLPDPGPAFGSPHSHPAGLALPFPHTSVFPETRRARGLSHHPGYTLLRTQVRFLSPHSLCSQLLSELLGQARAQVSNRDGLETIRARGSPVTCFALLSGFYRGRGEYVSNLRLSLLSDFFCYVFEVAFCYSVAAHSPFSAAVENTHPCSALCQALGFHVNTSPIVLTKLNRLGGPETVEPSKMNKVKINIWHKASPCSRKRQGRYQKAEGTF